jgi:hypothetical protein
LLARGERELPLPIVLDEVQKIHEILYEIHRLEKLRAGSIID